MGEAMDNSFTTNMDDLQLKQNKKQKNIPTPTPHTDYNHCLMQLSAKFLWSYCDAIYIVQ